MSEEIIVAGVNMTPEEKKRLKIWCTKRGMTIRQVLQSLVEEDIHRNKKRILEL